MAISIAHRIKRAMIGLTLVLCLVFTSLTLLLVYVVEDQVFINLLKSEQQQYEQSTVAERQHWQPGHQHMRLYHTWQDLPAEMQAIVTPGLGIYEYFDQGRAGFVLRGRLPESVTDYAISFDVSPLLAVRSSRFDLWLMIAVVSLVLLVVSVWVAYQLANKTLSPLKQLTQQLQDEHQELPHGFAADFYGDEVGVLAQQLEVSIDQAKQAAQREFEFNRGVSHELRTPIQIAQNALELLQLAAPGVDREQVIQRLQKALFSMQHITAAFLWLASDDSALESSCDGRAVMAQLLHNHQSSHPDRSIEVSYAQQVHYSAPTPVLTVILDNLLRNALQHSRHGVVRCEFNASTIRITNSLDHHHQQPGYGLGLGIVRRLCERLHWRLEVADQTAETFKITVHTNAAENT